MSLILHLYFHLLNFFFFQILLGWLKKAQNLDQHEELQFKAGKLARRYNYLNIKAVVWEEGEGAERSAKDSARPKQKLNKKLGGAVSIHLWKFCNCVQLYIFKAA